MKRVVVVLVVIGVLALAGNAWRQRFHDPERLRQKVGAAFNEINALASTPSEARPLSCLQRMESARFELGVQSRYFNAAQRSALDRFRSDSDPLESALMRWLQNPRSPYVADTQREAVTSAVPAAAALLAMRQSLAGY